MKGLVVAAALALVAALVLLWRDGGVAPGGSAELAAAQPLVEETYEPALLERAAVAPPPQQVLPVVEEPAPEPEAPLGPAFPRPAEWTPKVSEFVEAGLTPQQAEVLVAGLEHLQEHAPDDAALAGAIEKGFLPAITDRIVQVLGPGLVRLLVEKKIVAEWMEWKVPQPAVSHGFVVGFDNQGKLERLSFGARGIAGAVSFDLPLDACDQGLLATLQAVHDR